MALLRNRPIRDVVDKLDLALGENAPLVAPSSIAEARARLGEEPMLWLFAKTANKWAHASAAEDRWRGLALYGADGTSLLIADTPENTAYFGKAEGRATSGYPLMRMVALMALRSHRKLSTSLRHRRSEFSELPPPPSSS
jgi:hypothetical protein